MGVVKSYYERQEGTCGGINGSSRLCDWITLCCSEGADYKTSAPFYLQNQKKIKCREKILKG